MMRVITGTARGRKLITLPGTSTMPTSEKVKESVFSMIHFEVEGAKFLDLYAGSGQNGIEALSRGARECTFVENNIKCVKIINENLENTKTGENSKVVCSDVTSFLKSNGDKYDIIFADPPYASGEAAGIAALLAEVILPESIIIIETPADAVLPGGIGEINMYKEYKYGKTKITRYQNI